MPGPTRSTVRGSWRLSPRSPSTSSRYAALRARPRPPGGHSWTNARLHLPSRSPVRAHHLGVLDGLRRHVHGGPTLPLATRAWAVTPAARRAKATPARKPKTSDKLADYRQRRDPSVTPEPVPSSTAKRGRVPVGAAAPPRTFVIQEHHARALHWDFRLERDGVLVSWAVAQGLPLDKKTNHLAVHTEDHPLEYASFSGTIPHGEYGGGEVKIWDHGTYDELKWSDREVMVVLHGQRIDGTYVLFATKGAGRRGDQAESRSWMLHRMDDAPAGYEPLPRDLRPM